MSGDANSENKVYSPDIKVYSMEGRSGLFNTILTIIVGPIRLVTRVMHNIFILPANLLEDYANALMLCSIVVGGIGLIDLVVYKKWPLIVSQIVPLLYSLRLGRQAKASTFMAKKKRSVEINVEAVEELCGEVYTEIDKEMENLK